MKNKILDLLKEIEWRGNYDYSLGAASCPCCGKRGGIKKEADWYQGHSSTCKLNNLIKELKEK